MAKELIIRPKFQPDKDNPNDLTYCVEEDYIIKEVYLNVMSRDLRFKVVEIEKPKKVISKKKRK